MKETVIRTVVLVLALVNQILVSCGVEVLPISEEWVASLITTAAALWAWWKNNSFTREARMSDALMRRLKEERHEG